MGIKQVIVIMSVVIVMILILIYYFMPFNELEFTSSPLNYNFTINGNTSEVQFYPNMRFENNELSYKIDNCTLKKQNDMEYAFEIFENITILDFYSVSENEDITISCDEKTKIKEGMFIAGEGGPTKIIYSGNYYVILHGNILLLEDSKCEKPNVAMHELLHVLGFIHSDNPNNIMYKYTKCSQTIGKEIPLIINDLYSVPNYPDLVFENASASMNGRYLQLEIRAKNLGLKKSKEAVIEVNMKDDTLKEIELEELEIGNGKIITLTNLFIGKLNIDDIELFINYSEKELDKENNKLTLEVQ